MKVEFDIGCVDSDRLVPPEEAEDHLFAGTRRKVRGTIAHLMNNDQRRGSASDRTIEEGETYHHAQHGHVEVTGIWHRTQSLETTHNVDMHDMVAVRFIPSKDGTWIDELAEPLDDFLEAIN